MKITQAQKIKLGLFVLLTGVLLILALYLIGKKQNMFGNTIPLTAVFSNVNGLKLGNNVRYSGVRVGTVRKIEMVNDTTICVGMAVEQRIVAFMRKDARAVITSDGLVGSMVVSIYPGSSASPALKPGDTLRSYKKVSTSDMMSTLSITNQNVSELSRELLQISASLNNGQGTLGLLINDEEMGADLKQTVSNLKTASNDATLVLADIKEFVGKANNEDNLLQVMLNDTAAANQFRSILHNLEQSSAQIKKLAGGVNKVVDDINTGEGTYQYLMQDTVLVKNIDETVRNLKQGSILLNENLEAMRHSMFFKKYFKQQEKEAKKREDDRE